MFYFLFSLIAIENIFLLKSVVFCHSQNLQKVKALPQTICSTFYMGPISFWQALIGSDRIIMESHESYQKKSHRNKTKIFGSAGVELLSIPLIKGKHNKTNIREVEISNETNWRKKHINSIKEAYVRAPFFEFYFEPLSCLINNNASYLFDFNTKIIEWILLLLQHDITYTNTEYYVKNYPFKDLRNRKYTLDSNLEFQPTYPQVYEYKLGFQTDLSIIDLLMNLGPESKTYLKDLKSTMTISS